MRCRGPNRSPPQHPGDNGPAFLVIYCQEPALPTGNLVNTIFPVTLLGNLSPNMVKRTLVFRRSCDQRISSVACEPHVPLTTIGIKYNMLNLYRVEYQKVSELLCTSKPKFENIVPERLRIQILYITFA